MGFDHRGSYQGVTAQGEIFYRRSKGFAPDRGFIDLDLEDIKELTIIAGDVEWRPVNDKEFPQTSIVAWDLLRPTVSVDGFRPAKKRPEKGLRNYGDLVFQTWENGQKLPTVRYSDIYVDSETLEEMTEELAERRQHKYGIVRVPLTDIRSLYRDHGDFTGRINTRLQNGDRDVDSNNPKTKKPWTISEALQYLFSQLVGSPALHPAGEWNDLAVIEPCPPIRGKGEPTIEVLQKLVDELGLEGQMLPNNNWTLSSKNSKRIEYGKYPSWVNTQKKVPKEIHEETKTSRPTHRPSCVKVVGSEVIQRSIHPYVPVLKLDGKIFQVKDISHFVSGYSHVKVDTQVLSKDDGQFSDLLDLSMRQLLRAQAYRLYAPAHLFDLPISKATSTGASFVSEEDLGRYPYLPYTDVPFYKSELAQLGRGIPRDAQRNKGDREDIVLSSPVVYAGLVDAGTSENFSELKTIFQRWKAKIQPYLGDLNQQKRDLDRQLNEVGRTLSFAQITSKDIALRSTFVDKWGMFMMSRPGARSFYGHSVFADTDLDADLALAFKEVGVTIQGAKLAGDKMNESTFGAIVRAEAIAKKREAVKGFIREQKANLKKIEKEFQAYEKVYEKFGKIYAPLVNYPHGPVPEGRYSLDDRTGLLEFSVPACQMIQPFVLDEDVAIVGTHGQVMVVAASEYVDNVHGQITSVLVTARGEDPVRISYAGLCRSTPLKPKVESMGDIRLYLTEFGSSMNAGAVISAGMTKAFGQLARPKKIEGYTYNLDGFTPAVLDGGATAIEHYYDGDAVAYTSIAVNNPGSRTPIGIPNFKPKMAVHNYRTRLNIEQEGTY